MTSDRARKRIERLLDEAESCADNGDWVSVQRLAQEVLSFDPENVDASAFAKAAERQLQAQIQPGDSKGRLAATPVEADAIAPSSARTERAEAESSSTSVQVRAGARVPSQSKQGDSLPASFANGRYTVKKKLGEGGKKRVYLAHDTVLDRDVAFALIKTEGLDDAARQRITREAQAMGRLGDHPNIMPIFDLGQEKSPLLPGPGAHEVGAQGEGPVSSERQSQPYMVTPLMTGGDVERLIEQSPDRRMPLERAIQIATETTRGLAFAHSKGIVHRDLKPGNVWLTTEGTARIGDFGLAIATDRSRLTREGMMVGTVAYMPPEQAVGGDITPKADLYSLGCMLYEMVTGRLPFLGDDDIAIIGQHINTQPVAPAWHRPDCPRPLDALVMRLLAKDPGQRPESARDVLSALEAIAIALPGQQTASDPAESKDQGRSLDSMSSGVFVGRQKEMDQLRAALEEALSGHGRMLTLVGEPGIGKTRTAQELATYAGLRRSQVLWGRCYEGGGAPPYWPWVQAIRQYVRVRDADDLRREMGSTASVIAEVVTDVRDRIPGIGSPPALDSPESVRFRLFDSITAFLKTASRTQPLVIVLDDLHWSDKPSLLLLEFLARELANSRILLIGTYRDVEVNRRHPLSQTIGELNKERLFERVLLRGVQKHDIERFIQVAAGLKAPPGLVDAVHTQTEGNPLFVTEIVRWLIEEGTLSHRKAGETKTWSVPIPEGIRDVIGKRLDKLSERCNEVLTTAAVIGRRFAMAALVKLYSDPKVSLEERLSEERLFELMEEALAARIIEELPSGPGRYQFTHALMQETLTSELSTTRKVRLHARIAVALEELYGGEAEKRAAEMSAHFAEAEAVLGNERLVHYSLLAGEQALASFAYEDALRFFERVLAALPPGTTDEKSAAAYFGLGRAQTAVLPRSKQQTAVESLTKAFDIYVAIGEDKKALAAAAFPVYPIGGITSRAGLLERALPLVGAGSLDSGRLRAELSQHLFLEFGDRNSALRLAGEALSIAETLGDQKLALASRIRSYWLSSEVGSDQANDGMALAEAARAIGDADQEALVFFFAATRAYFTGDSRSFDQVALRLAESARRSKNISRLEESLLVQSVQGYRAGDWQAVFQSCSETLRLVEDSIVSVGIRALASLQIGETLAVKQDIQKMLEMMRSVQPGTSHWYTVPSIAIPVASIALSQDLGIAEAEQAGRIAASTTSPRTALANFGLSLSAVARSDIAAATAGYLQIIHLGRPGILGLFIDPQRAMGLIARTAGKANAAEEHLSNAISFLRKLNSRPELAWALSDLADQLEASADEVKHARAQGCRNEALSIARELGMKPLIERILKRRQFLKA